MLLLLEKHRVESGRRVGGGRAGLAGCGDEQGVGGGGNDAEQIGQEQVVRRRLMLFRRRRMTRVGGKMLKICFDLLRINSIF